ncbi:MAG: RNA 2',3'-cyclic phosphodiesterase [Halobacteriaceae archaeon]
MRLFVSVDLSPALHEAVAELQGEFADASGLNLTDPSQPHVTVKFLGDVDPGRESEVTETLATAVEGADVEPFEAEFGGLGVFPDLSYISVVWLGVRNGATELTRLHEAVESAFVERGFDPEDHEFTPHVTLARMEHAGGKELVQELVRETDPTVGQMRVEEVRLTESELGPSGPEYTTLARVPLG